MLPAAMARSIVLKSDRAISYSKCLIIKNMKNIQLNCFLSGLLLLLLLSGCTKNSAQSGDCWDPAWLTGTWEGTTPSSVSPYENTKIRIKFLSYQLVEGDTADEANQQAWAYTGTFTWDVDGTPWVQEFSSANYPQPGFNTIIWGCTRLIQANQTMNTLTIRMTDGEQTDPFHVMDLDCGPINDGTGKALTEINLYGDVQIDTGGNLARADYPPQPSTMIRLKKK